MDIWRSPQLAELPLVSLFWLGKDVTRYSSTAIHDRHNSGHEAAVIDGRGFGTEKATLCLASSHLESGVVSPKLREVDDRSEFMLQVLLWTAKIISNSIARDLKGNTPRRWWGTNPPHLESRTLFVWSSRDAWFIPERIMSLRASFLPSWRMNRVVGVPY